MNQDRLQVVLDKEVGSRRGNTVVGHKPDARWIRQFS